MNNRSRSSVNSGSNNNNDDMNNNNEKYGSSIFTEKQQDFGAFLGNKFSFSVGARQTRHVMSFPFEN